ncbi:hypothetical protein GIB67_012451 [Kingdonia uniflora]|uniref:C3H1-type domain-containing protein n=1 Tax=Kingdonia uniflora TaxID=39325 RepID=A0A7J7MVT8_9MAGN|nr:hypothetical protein GIB67_012451 [Kingdonia uniflora]
MFNPNSLDISKAGFIDVAPILDSDEFHMYIFKIKKCPRTRSHDWTECPYAHRGEKAKRRDPRKFNYSGVACPQHRIVGECKKGELCEFSHGIFEFWLHPARYRTRLCNAGVFCERKVCFFAHTEEQLRPLVKIKSHKNCIVHHDIDESNAQDHSTNFSSQNRDHVDIEWQVFGSLRDLGINNENEGVINVGWDASYFPDIEWITELVN